MTTSHNASCRCADCRARRAARAVDQGLHPSVPAPIAPARTPEEIEREEFERQVREWEALVASIRSDPLAYVMAKREEGVEFEAIAETLAYCGFDGPGIAALVEEARTKLNATRLRRGLGRMALGVIVAAAGVGLTFGLTSLFSGWIFVFWGLPLMGLAVMVNGLVTMFRVDRSGWPPPQ